MKPATIFLLIVALVSCWRETHSAGFKWSTHEERLSLQNSSFELDIGSNSSEFFLTLDSDAIEKYSGDLFGIEFEIEKLICDPKQQSPFEPSYLLITEEINSPIRQWTEISRTMLCDDDVGFTFSYKVVSEDAKKFGVRVRPIGSWSLETNSARLQAQFKVIRPITIGDGMAQREINMDPNIQYEVRLDRRGLKCADDDHEDWKCSLNMAVNKVKRGESDGISVSSDGKKSELIHKDVGENSRIYFEANNKLTIMSSGNNKEGFGASFTISTILHSQKSPKCPETYFDCCHGVPNKTTHVFEIFNPAEATCIPKEWTCDGKRNCPLVCVDADEERKVCEDQRQCETYWQMPPTAAIWILLPSFVAFVAVIFLLYAANSMWGKHKRTATTVEEYPPPYASCVENSSNTNQCSSA